MPTPSPWVASCAATRTVDAITARASDHLLRRRGWEAAPSELFGLLVTSDQRSGRTDCHRYYHLAMRCARAAASVDTGCTRDELDAVEVLQATLVGAMDRAGLARPTNVPAPAVAGGAPDQPPPEKRSTSCWTSSTTWSVSKR